MKSTNQLAILEFLWVFLGFFLKPLFGLLKIIQRLFTAHKNGLKIH